MTSPGQRRWRRYIAFAAARRWIEVVVGFARVGIRLCGGKPGEGETGVGRISARNVRMSVQDHRFMGNPGVNTIARNQNEDSWYSPKTRAGGRRRFRRRWLRLDSGEDGREKDLRQCGARWSSARADFGAAESRLARRALRLVI